MNDNTKTTSILLYQAPKKRVHLLRSDLKLRVRVLEAMEVLPWASKRHIQLWIRGEAPKRDSGIEGVLKQLVADGKLKTTTIEGGSASLTGKFRMHGKD